MVGGIRAGGGGGGGVSSGGGSSGGGGGGGSGADAAEEGASGGGTDDEACGTAPECSRAWRAASDCACGTPHPRQRDGGARPAPAPSQGATELATALPAAPLCTGARGPSPVPAPPPLQLLDGSGGVCSEGSVVAIVAAGGGGAWRAQPCCTTRRYRLRVASLACSGSSLGCSTTCRSTVACDASSPCESRLRRRAGGEGGMAADEAAASREPSSSETSLIRANS